MKYLILALIWAGYCALHSYLISAGFTKLLSCTLKKYYSFYRLFYILFSLALLIWVINYSESIDNEIIITYSHPWSLIRYIFMYGALTLFFWAFFFDYDSLSFFGIRQIMNFRKNKDEGYPGGLKKNGLLGIIRHPMYLALIIYLLCQNFRMADLVANTILIIYVFVGTVLEEKKLILEFGDACRQYHRDVPKLIPFIKKIK